jgi:hypothetical protein
MVWGQPGQIVWETYLEKYPTQNRAARVTQAVECLPSKCEALSSNSSTTTTTKNKKQKTKEEPKIKIVSPKLVISTSYQGLETFFFPSPFSSFLCTGSFSGSLSHMSCWRLVPVQHWPALSALLGDLSWTVIYSPGLSLSPGLWIQWLLQKGSCQMWVPFIANTRRGSFSLETNPEEPSNCHLPCGPNSQHWQDTVSFPPLRKDPEGSPKNLWGAELTREWSGFPMGRETVHLFPLESAQATQCQRLGIRQEPQRAVHTILAADPRVCYYWPHPFLLGRQCLDRTLFSV